MKRVFAVGCALVFVLAALAIGGGWWWVQTHKDELMARGEGAMKEGYAYGTGKDGPACVAEAEARLATTNGVFDEAANKVFLESCLKTAAIPPGFCDGVPATSEIMTSATWALARCASAPASSTQACGRLVGAWQQRCAKPH